MQVKPSHNGSQRVKSYCAYMVSALIISSGQSYENRYLLNLLLTNEFGLYKNLGAYKLDNHPHAMESLMKHDPDTPRLHEAMSDEHQDDFIADMGNEITELEQRNTWNVAKKDSLSRGANLIP